MNFLKILLYINMFGCTDMQAFCLKCLPPLVLRTPDGGDYKIKLIKNLTKQQLRDAVILGFGNTIPSYIDRNDINVNLTVRDSNYLDLNENLQHVFSKTELVNIIKNSANMAFHITFTEPTTY